MITHALWPLALAAASARTVTGAPEWRGRVGAAPPVPAGAVWLHAASVGEVAAATPLARALAARPEGAHLTVVTKTGLDVARRTLPELAPSLAPLDFVVAVRRRLRSAGPRALLLTETELWPNTVYESTESGATVGMVNGRLSERSLRRYSMRGSPLAGIADRISFAACRTEDDAQRFRALGLPADGVVVVGDMKFDKLAAPLGRAERAGLRTSLGIPEGVPVVVFGSVRPKEEAAVARAASEVSRELPDARFVAAPRHLERVAPLTAAMESAGVACVPRSTGGDVSPGGAVVLDTTGELARTYGVASAAFVGGTLAPYGGHDPLEPAAQGVPVVIGPHTETCAGSAERLLRGGGAFEARDAVELAHRLLQLLRDGTAGSEAGELALRAVDEGRGATGRTMDFLESVGVLDATG
jgi:3-deoxy-D-manno-octulosonic-acid transferase